MYNKQRNTANKEMQPAALIWIVFSSSNVFYNILHYINNKYVCMSLKAKHMKLPQHQYRPLGATQGLFMDMALLTHGTRKTQNTYHLYCMFSLLFLCLLYVCMYKLIHRKSMYILITVSSTPRGDQLTARIWILPKLQS